MLKSLELFGFKSFADRTSFDFAPGITCVVGPNGSGKSNVVDALKWLLGDQSAKSLRGKEMIDVIFNGAAGRKASAFAEATLTFDNASKLLPIDSAEVHIGRRIWRNGDSEYLINRAPARLKDVRDLFLGTGAGSAAYSIIEQGRVDQILQANASARRSVFEEAAGISKFRAKKLDAQRKLERVGQNLLRLTDIVDEVEAQLNATRSQAAKAAKFRELTTDLKRWWLGLAADDHRHITYRLGGIEQELQQVRRQLDELSHKQKEIESREAEFDQLLASVDEELYVVERQLAGAREASAAREATIQYQTSRLQELDADLVRLAEQRTLLATRRQATETELTGLTDKLAEATLSLQHFEQRIVDVSDHQQLADRLAAQRGALDRDRLRAKELADALANAATQLAAFTGQHEQLAAARQRQVDRLHSAEQQLSGRQLDHQKAQSAVQEQQSLLLALTGELKGAQSRRQHLQATVQATQQTLSQVREGRSAAQARKKLLEDLELQQEGVGIGVREILKRAKSMSARPWSTVIGLVSDLLEVNLEQAALLEVALGHRAQWIVLRDLEPMIDYLESGASVISGRVGFVELNSKTTAFTAPSSLSTGSTTAVSSATSQIADLSAEPGVISRADTLATAHSEVPSLASQVLADTWVVESLTVARRLAAGIGEGQRFVTLQGEVLESEGTLYAGTIRNESAVLPRKSELRRLKLELAEQERQIRELDAELTSYTVSLAMADNEIDSASQRVESANTAYVHAQSGFAAYDTEVTRLLAERQEIEKRLAQIETESQALTEAQANVEAASQEAAIERRALDAILHEKTAALQQLENEVFAAAQLSANHKYERAQHEQRITNLHEQQFRLTEELHQRVLQQEEAERRYTAAVDKRSSIVEHLLVNDEQQAEQRQAAEIIAGEVMVHQQRKQKLRAERATIVEIEQGLRKERRQLNDHLHTLEIRQRDLQHALQTLIERLREEDNLEIERVTQEAQSALSLLQAEQAPDEESASSVGDGGDAHSDGWIMAFEAARPELDARVSRLRKKLKLLGNVDTDSLQKLEEIESRFIHMSEQLQDLVEAKTTLEDIIRRINLESRRLFQETFDIVRGHFQDLFRRVFGGGEGDIVLEDPSDILESGIDIKARPPGKELRSISLLSGGEKTMTAIALIMAIFKAKPSPFCILDEVDAALDEANVERFTSVVQQFRDSTQFIMITHHKRSMTVADVLYGVTMEESGVSKRMSVRFEEVTEDGHFRTAA